MVAAPAWVGARCSRLQSEGVELFVSARGEERLNKSCEEIAQQTGASITPIAADHSSDEGRERILAACPDPDILVGTCSPPPVTGDYQASRGRGLGAGA